MHLDIYKVLVIILMFSIVHSITYNNRYYYNNRDNDYFYRRGGYQPKRDSSSKGDTNDASKKN